MNDPDETNVMLFLERQRARQRAEDEAARAARLRRARLREGRLLRRIGQQQEGLRARLLASWR